jgi:hypothetical protein
MLVLESCVGQVPLKSASNSVARNWREKSRVVTMSENSPKFRRILGEFKVWVRLGDFGWAWSEVACFGALAFGAQARADWKEEGIVVALICFVVLV